jgi:DNA polymerase III alpha subunit (gram-positive type)
VTKVYVIDSEGIGLAHHATKLHNLCWTTDGENFGYTTDYQEMRKFLTSGGIYVCHNALGHDMPAFNKVLGLELTRDSFWDTLWMSYNLYPERKRHGLESWGEDLGVSKVKVEEHQWAEGDTELMRKRVEEDVKINWLVWLKMLGRYREIYG